jgi:hypothetical protein
VEPFENRISIVSPGFCLKHRVRPLIEDQNFNFFGLERPTPVQPPLVLVGDPTRPMTERPAWLYDGL